VELQDYFRVLRKRWRIVVMATLFGVLLTGSYAYLSTPQYQAETELFVAPRVGGTSADLANGATFVQDRVKSYAQVIGREIVLRPVIDELGLDESVQDLAARVTVTAPTDTVLLRIQVTDITPAAAAEVANAVAEQFQSIAGRLEPARADTGSVVTITVVEPAVPPTAPFAPDKKLYIALGVLAGLALGLGLAVGRERLDQRIRRDSDVKRFGDLPIIGHIPADKGAAKQPLIVGTSAQGARAEAFRQLRTNLQFLDVPFDRRSFVITSSMNSEGKTTSAINIALTHAEAGLSVCLVDADLRRPSIAAYLDLEPTTGLTDILVGKVPTENATITWGLTTLDVITSGPIPPNPSELLSGEAMQLLLTGLANLYDVVIVDAPPLLPVTDATILAKRCAGAIVVVGCGKHGVTRTQLGRSLNSLAVVEAKVLGIVMNRVPTKGPDSIAVASYAQSLPAQRRPASKGLARRQTRPGRHGAVDKPLSRKQGPSAGAPAVPAVRPVNGVQRNEPQNGDGKRRTPGMRRPEQQDLGSIHPSRQN
jgi:succinoglycan biosynthesis transport protein ExoP